MLQKKESFRVRVNSSKFKTPNSGPTGGSVAGGRGKQMRSVVVVVVVVLVVFGVMAISYGPLETFISFLNVDCGFMVVHQHVYVHSHSGGGRGAVTFVRLLVC